LDHRDTPQEVTPKYRGSSRISCRNWRHVKKRMSRLDSSHMIKYNIHSSIYSCFVICQEWATPLVFRLEGINNEMHKLQFENREKTKFFNECGQKDIYFLALRDSIEENDKQ
jgi:hypothetical protein